jgi:hypothetical protein
MKHYETRICACETCGCEYLERDSHEIFKCDCGQEICEACADEHPQEDHQNHPNRFKKSTSA